MGTNFWLANPSIPQRVKLRSRELTQGQNGRQEVRLLKGHAQSDRVFEDNNEISWSQSIRTGEEGSVPTVGSEGNFQNGSPLWESVTSLICRLQQGFYINPNDYVDILQRCFKQKDLDSLKQVHECVKRSGLEQNRFVANNLLTCYIRCGRLTNAQEIFDKFVKRTTVSWNIMIGGYAQHDQAEDAIRTYKLMRHEGGRPSAATYLNALKACTSPRALMWGKDIHAHIIRDGLQADVRVSTALVSMYAKCGSVDDGRKVFDGMKERNVVSWNAMIGAFAQHGLGHEAFSCFQEMQREGTVPNAVTYQSVLNSKACEGAIEWVKEVHSQATRSGLIDDVRVGTALVNMYSNCDSIDDARMVFDRIEKRDIVCWTAMIGALAQHGLGHQAFSLFLQMQRQGYVPDLITYVSILNPCSSPGASEWVKEVHSHALKANLDVDLRVGNALVHMYAKIGSIADARLVFDKMLDRDVISWTAMIGGLAQHGHGREALQLFKEMKLKGVKPNGPSFVAVLSACCHAGLVDEGRFQFVSMTHGYGLEPALEHFNCMVDILGRAGQMEEAMRFILNLPIKPNIVTWTALLGACRIYERVEMAELAAKECINLEPTDPSPYILLSNIYAAVGEWDKVSMNRNMMQGKGIFKEPGRCWIEIDNKVHHFVAGDKSHPEAREIYARLNTLSSELKAEGYIPDTRLILRDIDEKDKESALCFHSEKLALAYGLMHVAEGNLIRIYKNLRMCVDCHIATKLISKIKRRDIVARDANRFHHFKDGVCSCGDYW